MTYCFTSAALALCASVQLPCTDTLHVMAKTGYTKEIAIVQHIPQGKIDSVSNIQGQCLLFATWFDTNDDPVSLYLCRDESGVPTS